MMLPALSVKQPWADLIARGAKHIETRLWATRYRGPLVICSSRLPKGQGVTGRALCVVFLKHCRTMELIDQDAACCTVYGGAVAWIFAEQRICLIPEPVRGQLGIFPLSLPERAFYLPEERALAYEWLDWAKEKGFFDGMKGM